MSDDIRICKKCGRKFRVREWGFSGPGGKEPEEIWCPYKDCGELYGRQMSDGHFITDPVSEESHPGTAMKAVILAAGLGSRLRPITNEVPKCMVPVNGIRIIDKQIDNLVKAGVRDVYVVSGYKAEVLDVHLKTRYPFVTVIPNSRYAETNNMYSLYLAAKHVKGSEFLLMNSDVYFDANIIVGMISGEGSKIACDRSMFLEESMKVTLGGNKINHISKKITEQEHYAVSIDVYRISAKDGEILFKEIEDTIVGRHDENSWTEVALDRIFDKTEFCPYIIEGRWFEIDNHDDLARAEKIFWGDKIS